MPQLPSQPWPPEAVRATFYASTSTTPISTSTTPISEPWRPSRLHAHRDLPSLGELILTSKNHFIMAMCYPSLFFFGMCEGGLEWICADFICSRQSNKHNHPISNQPLISTTLMAKLCHGGTPNGCGKHHACWIRFNNRLKMSMYNVKDSSDCCMGCNYRRRDRVLLLLAILGRGYALV